MKFIQTVNFEDLKIDDVVGFGSFTNIYKCQLDGKEYAYKEFSDSSILKTKKTKLNELSLINEHLLATPKFRVRKDRNKRGYLTRIVNGTDIITLQSFNLTEQINYLRNAKDKLRIIHLVYNLIHGDLSSANIMLENSEPCFVDFDNCTYKKSLIKIDDASDYAQEFIKTYGVVPVLDVFLFNLLTFEILNNVNIQLIRNKIMIKDLGVFSSLESKKICGNFFLCEKNPTNEYLIDTVDEAYIKI